MKYTEIDHFSHQHTLVLEEAMVPYICSGCKQLGFAPCYQCKICNFHLHEDCARPKPSISSASHRFLKGCKLVFHDEAPTCERYCDACGEDIEGFWYQCTHDRPHDLHPCCLNLPRTLTNKTSGASIRLSDKMKSTCIWCDSRKVKQGVKGWCYVSSHGDCFHIACFKQALLENWKKGYFSNSLQGYGMSSGLELMQRNENAERAMVKRDKSKRAWKIVSKILMFIRLVVSAFFGDPTAIVVCLLADTLNK